MLSRPVINDSRVGLGPALSGAVPPQVDGVPCTGLNTGTCIGLPVAGQTPGN